ncbi:MAG: outer membrane lipid asymmetry maintenance protein MlaD [Gammaproteobacteria bacterium]|nr:outer membrane lipid asymmetry maintenance protein MlaD [Gammaproteobacteria bacterium]MCB1791066.1 outer membrane lipid asymmetry maintenance protein MlaD [Gammaproteobacteria bacterium]
MSKTTQLEILVGAFMAAGFVALFFLAMQVSNLGTVNSGDAYRITARFDNIGGLKAKAPVTLAGVEVGRVLDIYFDSKDFRAVAVLGIYSQYNQIPDDTFAKILTAGLLGEQYVGLDPGGSESVLKEGSEIAVTQSALVLEEVIGQFIYGKAQEGAN